MTKYILTFCMLIFGLNAYSTSLEHIRKTAEKILDELYEVHGNHSVEKPKIVITEDEKEIASYRRRSNSIVLSVKAFTICESFESESKSALAFLIGHELTHAFQSESIHGTTGFLAHSEHPESRESLENEADIQGVLMAYLAGYETTNLLPDLIERIYADYNLMSKKLSGYPSFSKRQTANERVILLANQLLDLFEGGNYLAAIGEYELAAACFEYIKNYYQGAEIFINLGVNYSLHALHLTDENIEPFVYPFEIEWETRLRKKQNSGGTKDLSPYENRLREKYLFKAENAFKNVLKNAPENHAAKVNLMSIFNLRGDYMAAMSLYQNENWNSASKRDFSKANLVSAITYYRVGNKSKAVSILSELAKHKSAFISAQASCNLESLSGENVCKNDGEACPYTENLNRFAKPVIQKNEKNSKPILLNERSGYEVVISKTDKHKKLTFSQKQKHKITLNWDFDTTTTTELNNLKPENPKNALSTTSGILIPCHNQRVIYRISTNHTVLEKVFY